jgi:glutamate racemase
MHAMPDASSPIGIFDSGVGGLSVLVEVRRLLPGEDNIYYADAAPTSDSTTSAAPLPDERSSADFAVCGACNARNPGGAKFCATCGSAMAA